MFHDCYLIISTVEVGTLGHVLAVIRIRNISIAGQIFLTAHFGRWFHGDSQPFHYGFFLHEFGANANSNQLLNAGWLPFGNFGLQFGDPPPRPLLHPSFPPLLHQAVQRVQEGVESRVERQHEDGGPHVDLARDGSSTGSQETHRPMGNQQQKSVKTTRKRRRARVMSFSRR